MEVKTLTLEISIRYNQTGVDKFIVGLQTQSYFKMYYFTLYKIWILYRMPGYKTDGTKQHHLCHRWCSLMTSVL